MGVGEETAQTLLQVTSKATLITADVILAAIRSLNKVLRTTNNTMKSLSTSNVKSTVNTLKSGKQSIKNLSKHNVALDSIPVTNIDIKKMTAMLKGYGVDFSVIKNKQTNDFNLFFKATDTAVISAAFEQVINENDRSNDDKTSDKDKKPLSEQKEEAQEKADKKNAEKAAEKADRQQEKQKNKGREKDR